MKKKFLLSLILCLLLFLQAFRSYKRPGARSAKIELKAFFGDRELVLEKEKYVNAAGDTLYVDRFRFYLSSLKVKFSDGNYFAEKNSYHLIDFADSVAPTVQLNNIPNGKISGIEFLIGIDSATSVAGAMGGDLDPVNGMYWAWNSGYINAKLEGRSKSCATYQNAFEFHVGGYLSPNYSARKVSLAINNSSDPANDFSMQLIADASAWFNGISLSKTNSIVIPGEKAMKMADSYSKMFSVFNN